MKTLILIMILILTIMFSGDVFADSPPAYGFDLSINGKYIWRGMPFNSETVLWPDAWINWKGFTGIVWVSMDLTDVKQDQWNVTDVFFYLDYSRTFGPVDCSIGYGHYIFPGYNDLIPTTGEIYGKVGSDLAILYASLTAYLDIDKTNGYYITPEISKDFSFGLFTSTPSVSVGYADNKHNLQYFYLDKAGFTDLTVKLGFSFSPSSSLGNYMLFTGNINYSKILDEELAEMYEDDTNFWWGIGMSLFFGGE